MKGRRHLLAARPRETVRGGRGILRHRRRESGVFPGDPEADPRGAPQRIERDVVDLDLESSECVNSHAPAVALVRPAVDSPDQLAEHGESVAPPGTGRICAGVKPTASAATR